MRVLSALVLFACAASAPWAGTSAHAKAGERSPAAHHPTAPASPRAAQLLGMAFRTKGGVGEVVIRTSGEVELEARDDGASPVFILKRCRVLRANDRRPLDTRFFDSPVTAVSLKERGADIQIAVSLRDPTTATPRKEHGPGNSWYWILAFPPGTTAEKSPRAVRPTAAVNP